MESGGRLAALRRVVEDFAEFSRVCYPGRALRRYQVEAALPVIDAVERGRGGAFGILFSRQAGKDELLAQLEAFLLMRYRLRGGNIVVGAPTFKPQCMVSRRRLIERAKTALHPGMRSAEGYRVECGKAGVSFLSTEATANVRGETADVLLVANEAQDITTERWDAVFSPMAASTNAPSLFSGTPWMAGSLLSRERQMAREAGTLFEAGWERVAQEVPAYREHVRGRMAKLGERHPFILSEYCLRELGADGGLFPPERQAQMRGEHERRCEGVAGRTYAMLLDVAGSSEDQSGEPGDRGREKRRDSTALTVVEVDTSVVRDPLVARPAYRVVCRYVWRDVPHKKLYSQLLDLARNVWRARYVVVDSTGVGAGLSSFLGAALNRAGKCEVVPFLFGVKSKSDLGWGFLGVIESGRFKDYRDDGSEEQREFWRQVEGCEYTVDEGPGKIMRWAVPGAKGHDDLLVSAALVGVLDERDWAPRSFVGRVREDYV